MHGFHHINVKGKLLTHVHIVESCRTSMIHLNSQIVNIVPIEYGQMGTLTLRNSSFFIKN